jgi:beta-phosphoglucomutase-like phosphatase (HAD superfamily)
MPCGNKERAYAPPVATTARESIGIVRKIDWRTKMETPLSLVIFDCDGVLVDSEMTINRVLAREITALGWSLTPAQSQAIFLGLSLSDIMPMVEGRTGKKLPSNWPAQISELTAAALADGVPLIPVALACGVQLVAAGTFDQVRPHWFG